MAAAKVKIFGKKITQNMLNSLVNASSKSLFTNQRFLALSRCTHSVAKENVEDDNEDISRRSVRTEFTNRNPRNVEYKGIAKPRGYGTQFSRRDFYNKLNLIISNRHIKAYLQHNGGTVLLSASTTEFPIAKQLYKTTDTMAAMNVGRVLAQRCLEAGFTRVCWEPRWKDKHKKRLKAFTTAIQKQGITLNEPRAVFPLHNFYSDFKPRKTKKKWKKMPNSEKRKYI